LQGRLTFTDGTLTKSFCGVLTESVVRQKYRNQSGTGPDIQSHKATEPREIIDGLSNTLLVGETSGKPLRADGYKPSGRTTDAFINGSCRPDWVTTSHKGLTTVRHPPGTTSAAAIGSSLGRSPNVPLKAGHPHGAHVHFCDGAVRFFTGGIDL
jgi:hypothetical protein